MSTAGLRDYGRLLSLPTQRKLFSLFSGRHQGQRVGRSHELLDLDQYQVGDDVKSIDWKSSARNEQPIIKRFEATAQLRIELLVDGSRAMGAAAPTGRPKLEVAAEIATALGWVALAQSELFGAAIAAGDTRMSFPARTGLLHAQGIINAIERFQPQGKPQLETMMRYYAGKPRALLFLVTDFSAITDRMLGTLAQLSATHRPHILLVEDADPTALDASAEDLLAGTLPEFTRTDEAVIEQWRAYQASLRANVDAVLRQRRIPYATVSSPEQVLNALLLVLAGGANA